MREASRPWRTKDAGYGKSKPAAYPVAGKGARPGRALALLPGVAIALGAFVLYLLTLAPTVLPYSLPDLADAAMLQMQACSLSITHPTGYPTWTVLAHLATYLPVGDCAYRVNLASAVFAALAALAVYAAGLLVTYSVVASAVGSLAFALTGVLWSQAVIAEVYTMNAFFVGLALAALLAWRVRQRDGYLILSALCVGLAMTNHLTSALLLPASLLLVLLVDFRKLLDVPLLLKSAGAFMVGLSPYLFLPLRAPSAPMKANNPDNLERFLRVLGGGDLTGGFFAFGPAELPGRVAMYWGYLLESFNLPLILAGAAGLAALALRDLAVAASTAFLFFGWSLHAIENDIVDVQLYFIPTYVIFGVWICCGAAALLRKLMELRHQMPGLAATTALAAVCAGLLLLPLVGVRQTYAANDRSQNRDAARTLDTVAAEAAPGATVLHLRSPLWYMVIVEERRRDLTLVDPFQNSEPGVYNDVIWPGDHAPGESRRVYGTDDDTGVEAARKAAERGPVYLLAHDNLDPEPLREAGFRLVPQGDSFYRLIPPDGIAGEA